MEFRCDINIGTDAVGRLDGDPSPDYDNGEYFTTGEMMTFKVPTYFKKPQESDCTSTYCEYTKFVRVIVKSGSSEICKSEPIEIFDEGHETMTINTCELKEEYFSSFTDCVESGRNCL